MYALIMSGGRASRLCMGEKALARLGDNPLISYVLRAVTNAGLKPVVVVSPLTPYTANYCRINQIDHVCTDGQGYVEDLKQAVTELAITGPLLTICTDLPGITADHITMILNRYQETGLPACSVWSEKKNVRSSHPDNTEKNELYIPVGLNIIRGDLIDQEQEEYQIIVNDPLLAININTREDLIAAERVLDLAKKAISQPTLL